MVGCTGAHPRAPKHYPTTVEIMLTNHIYISRRNGFSKKDLKKKYIRWRKEMEEKRKLPTVFDCLSCARKETVTVKLDYHECIGSLRCVSCKQSYVCSINKLEEEIDVFSSWVDDSNFKLDRIERCGNNGHGDHDDHNVHGDRDDHDDRDDRDVT